jgi:hypothetical protein
MSQQLQSQAQLLLQRVQDYIQTVNDPAMPWAFPTAEENDRLLRAEARLAHQHFLSAEQIQDIIDAIDAGNIFGTYYTYTQSVEHDNRAELESVYGRAHLEQCGCIYGQASSLSEREAIALSQQINGAMRAEGILPPHYKRTYSPQECLIMGVFPEERPGNAPGIPSVLQYLRTIWEEELHANNIDAMKVLISTRGE